MSYHHENPGKSLHDAVEGPEHENEGNQGHNTIWRSSPIASVAQNVHLRKCRSILVFSILPALEQKVESSLHRMLDQQRTAGLRIQLLFQMPQEVW